MLSIAGALFVDWYLLLDNLVEDGRIGGAGLAQISFAILSPAMLVEEFYSGLSVEQALAESGLLVADLASSSLFALMHLPRWFALGNFAPPLVARTL